MAFGYKLPNFNTWARFYKRQSDGLDPDEFTGPWYFRCQVKRIERSFVNEVLTEKWLGFRSADQTPGGLGDIIQVAGYENQWGVVVSVFDIGAGFPNEHRGISIVHPQDSSSTSDRGLFFPSVRTDLEPPPGWEPMYSTVPADFWETPGILLGV